MKGQPVLSILSRDEIRVLSDSENPQPVYNGEPNVGSNGDDRVDHDSPNVNSVRLEFVRWSHRQCETLKGTDSQARDRLREASQSILLNLLEGNAKLPLSNQKQSLPIALGSVLACADALDVLVLCGAMDNETASTGYDLLFRLVC